MPDEPKKRVYLQMENYQDAKQRARKAQMELENKSLPPYKKVDRALWAFKGIVLSSIPHRMKMTVESVMIKIQQILNRYPIETIEDYQLISEDDLDEMMNHIAALCRYILSYK